MGVYVLGMHRSGTSAVTRVVNLLGVPIGREEKLMPVQADNPAGFWEHLGLMEVNDAVLARLGGSWDAPPLAPDGFASSATFADLRARACEEFDATYDGDRWVFKDPRVSVLMPFWREVLTTRGDATVPDVAVIVLRNPLDIAASLQKRNHLATAYVFALWERYLRLVLRDAHGLPAIVVDYDDLLDDRSTVDALDAFLTDHGAVAGGAGRAEIGAFLADSLRHNRTARDAFLHDTRATAEQHALFELCERLLGRHDRLVVSALPDESTVTEALLAARRGDDGAGSRALDAMTRQLGETEAALAECRTGAVAAQATHDAVTSVLGYAAIGRLERAALGAARRARAVQQRFGRR
jgi:hypothetical protein